MSEKAYNVKNQMVVGPNFAPFQVYEGFDEHALCGMLNECHDYAMRLLDTRLHEVCLEREQARTERNYERHRRMDDEAVWLETRDANKRLTEKYKRLETHTRQVAHWAQQFILAIENTPEFGAQPKYGNGLVGNLWRSMEAAFRFIDKDNAAEAQRPSGNDPESQGEARS